MSAPGFPGGIIQLVVGGRGASPGGAKYGFHSEGGFGRYALEPAKHEFGVEELLVMDSRFAQRGRVEPSQALVHGAPEERHKAPEPGQADLAMQERVVPARAPANYRCTVA